MSIEIERVRTHGFTMRFFRFGSGARPFVIIPGLSVQSVMGAAEAIAKDYGIFSRDFTAYVFDRREDAPQGYSLDDMARDTACAFDELGLRGVCLFGASQGGMISMKIAIERPELVGALALGSTAARVDGIAWGVVEKWIRLAGEKDAKALYLDFGEKIYPPEVFAEYRDALCAAAATVTPSELERFGILAGAMKGFDVTEELAALRCPVLVTGSSDDAVLGADALPTLAASIAGAQVKAYDGFGHAAYDLAPDYKETLYRFFLGQRG